ncbi:hypothetical protein RB653_006329 [Dictyostelium firmibasis]|uniref:Cytochrome P450 n=1 Tax=Dictyostelium firmibasis TaxID=79012 RepID=A0AAN7UD86_9MYCE
MNFFITIFILIICYFLFFKKENRIRKINSKIPGPKGLPIIGNLHEFKKDPQIQFQNWYEKYGTIYSVRMGNIDSVVLTGYPIIRKAFVDNSNAFAPRFQRWSRMKLNGCKNLIGSNDELHTTLKKIVLSEMTPTRIKRMENHIVWECEKLCKVLDKHCESGLPFSLNMYCKLFSLNIIMRFLFGIDYSYENQDNQHIINIIIEFFFYGGNAIVSDFIPIIRPFYKENKFFQLYPVVCGHINQLIENYKLEKGKKPCGVDQEVSAGSGASSPHISDDGDGDNETIMGKLLEEFNNGSIGWDSLVSTCVDVFLGGTDTTSNSIIFSLIALANNPDRQDKLYDQIKNNLQMPKNELVVRHSIHRSSIPYLSLVIKEIYRLYPVSLLGLPHITTEDVEIGGYTIAKGTQIIQNIFASHKCEKTFPSPNSFIPERFIETGCNNMFGGGPTNLVHFGTGVRDCIGKSLADCEFYTLLATLINRYEFINPSTSEPLNDIGIFGVAYQPPDNQFFIKRRI